MTMRRGTLARVLGSLAAGAVGLALLVPGSVCGCITTDMWFAQVFGATPSQAGPPAIRGAILARVPVGTSFAEVTAAAARLQGLDAAHGVACKAPPDRATIACDVVVEESLVRLHELRVHLEFIFADGRLSDVHVDKTRSLLGLRL